MTQVFASERSSQPQSAPASAGKQSADPALERLQAHADASPATAQLARMTQLEASRPLQRAGIEEEEPLQGKAKDGQSLQLQPMEEEEELQMKSKATDAAAVQLMEDEEPLQGKSNKTGMPDNLKSGIENLSGTDMSDVNVHYNSAKPAAVQAHAYAQGSDIHLASGQEKHLPHEAWHVVQQAQGRVQPTTQLAGIAVNDDAALETEADQMGAKAAQFKPEDGRA